MRINIERCLIAMRDLEVSGCCNTEQRQALIADAIARIQKDPAGAMKTEYLGIKNYASFGDQRTDCSYGMGPRHGSIVFRIGRPRNSDDTPLGADHIYLLECIRDAEPIKELKTDPVAERNRIKRLNLIDALKRWDRFRKLANAYFDAASSQKVYPHDGDA